MGLLKKVLTVLVVMFMVGGCDDDCTIVPSNVVQTISLKCGKYDVAIEIVDADRLNTAINGEKIAMYREGYFGLWRQIRGQGCCGKGLGLEQGQ